MPDTEIPARPLRITLVNQYFPPDTSATAAIFADLVNAIDGAGHRTNVICGRPSYRPSSSPSAAWRPFRRASHPGAEVHRVGSTALTRDRGAGRAANYGSFLALATLRAATMPRPDVVIAGTDPPLAILPGLVAARGRPLVYHLQDLHPEAALAAGWIRPGRAARAWERLHRTALRRAALVVVLGERMADTLVAKGIARERIVVVPNGAPRNAGEPERELVGRIRGNAPFVAVHAGNIGVAGDWDTVMRAHESLGDGADFVFLGDGAEAQRVAAAGIRIESFNQDVASVMAAGDLQLVTLREDMEGLLVPSKLYTALAHGRPVLALVPPSSEVAQTVLRWECGLVVAPGDAEGLARAVHELAGDGDRVAAMAAAARRAGEALSRERLFAELVRTIERLTPR